MELRFIYQMALEPKYNQVGKKVDKKSDMEIPF